MNSVTANPFLGIGLHAIGAIFAATCYTPQKRVRGWSWQTDWLTQAAFCWFLLPILGAWLTTPDFAAVLREAPRGAMRSCFLLGAAYGIVVFGDDIPAAGWAGMALIVASGIAATILRSRAAPDTPAEEH